MYPIKFNLEGEFLVKYFLPNRIVEYMFLAVVVSAVLAFGPVFIGHFNSLLGNGNTSPQLRLINSAPEHAFQLELERRQIAAKRYKGIVPNVKILNRHNFTVEPIGGW